eukprot:scaffold4599_cov219-Amphora_coffeaeformis.AAC.16
MSDSIIHIQDSDEEDRQRQRPEWRHSNSNSNSNSSNNNSKGGREQDEDEEEIVITQTRTIFQVVSERTRQAEQEGRVIHLETVAATAVAATTTVATAADGSLLGRRVYKQFGKDWYFGTVTSITLPDDNEDTEEENDDNVDSSSEEASCPYYKVVYDDDDEEEYSWDEIQPWLQAAEQNRHLDPQAAKQTKNTTNMARSTTTTTTATTPVRVKRERTESAGAVAVVTPPPKKRTPPSRFEAHMWKTGQNESQILWLSGFTEWLVTQNLSASNAKSVLRQVTKLALGQGIGYKQWPKDVIFGKDLQLNLTFDFDQLIQEARLYEETYGADKGNGWYKRFAPPAGWMRRDCCQSTVNIVTKPIWTILGIILEPPFVKGESILHDYGYGS